MFSQFLKKTLFSKFISGLVAVSFIITSVPVKGYANADKLRGRAGIDPNKTKEIIGELKKTDSHNPGPIYIDGHFVPGNSHETYAARLEIMRNRILFGGNWKERKDIVDEASARAKAKEFKEKFSVKEGLEGAEVVIFPEAKWVKAVAEELKGTNISVGVQSLFFGAPSDPNNFTLSRLQEKIDEAVAMGARYANVGHSMHRKSGEGLIDEQANKIMKAILNDGRLIPWYTIEVSGKKDPNEEIADGINIGLSGITKEQIAVFPITPEPTVLISTKDGSGKIDTTTKVSTADTANLSRLVVKALAAKYGQPVETNVGYGASVKAENAREIFSNIEVRNALIGGASLEAKGFFETVVNGMKGRPAQTLAKAEIALDPIEVSGVNDLMPIITNNGIKQAILSCDWNTPLKEDGRVEDNEKLVNSVDTIKWFKESGLQYLYVMTHSGRPSGTGYEESSSLKPIVDEARRLFTEEGVGDIEIILLPYDFVQAKKVIDAKKAETAISGKKVLFVLENIRMYSAERSKDPAIREQFEKAIIALTGEEPEKMVYLYAGFEKYHRAEEASIEMGFLLFPRDHIAAGVHEVEEIVVT